MTALNETDRSEVWKRLMRQAAVPGSVVKAEFRAAVDACDDWIEANAAAFNAALPQPYRGAASSAQKAALLAAVALKKFGRNI